MTLILPALLSVQRDMTALKNLAYYTPVFSWMAKFSSVQSEMITENIDGSLSFWVFLLLFPSWEWRWVEVSALYRCLKQRCKQILDIWAAFIHWMVWAGGCNTLSFSSCFKGENLLMAISQITPTDKGSLCILHFYISVDLPACLSLISVILFVFYFFS